MKISCDNCFHRNNCLKIEKEFCIQTNFIMWTPLNRIIHKKWLKSWLETYGSNLPEYLKNQIKEQLQYDI